MSTSELRRGPGWWMDLEGQWNPPEEWPEATPPLPGWTRGHDGLWSQPAFIENLHKDNDGSTAGKLTQSTTKRPVLDIGMSSIPSLDSLKHDAEVQKVPERRVAEDRRTAPTKAENVLTFGDAIAHMPLVDDRDRVWRRAIMSATLAAVTASMLAAGLVLLLLLL
jgi:hypothetical protein